MFEIVRILFEKWVSAGFDAIWTQTLNTRNPHMHVSEMVRSSFLMASSWDHLSFCQQASANYQLSFYQSSMIYGVIGQVRQLVNELDQLSSWSASHPVIKLNLFTSTNLLWPLFSRGTGYGLTDTQEIEWNRNQIQENGMNVPNVKHTTLNKRKQKRKKHTPTSAKTKSEWRMTML